MRTVSYVCLIASFAAAGACRADEPSTPPAAQAPAEQRSAEAKPDEKPDEERILGTWALARGNRKEAKDGEEQEGTRVTLTFEADNRWTAVVDAQGAKQEIGGQYYLDPKPTPRTFDLTLVAGDYRLSVYAIYELSDDELRLRFHLDGRQRPADFTSPAEGASLYVFKRAKTQE
ncbi:MAG: TIGR03067 domain-containing protein [Pirellulales bacterium]